MANKLDANQGTITNMANTVANWKVDSGHIDDAQDSKETYWDYPESNERLGYYQLLPELNKSIGILAMYTTGDGWKADNRTTVILENMTGWGEDTFESISWNLLVQKKVFGDAFAEVIRNERGDLINLKPLYTGDMRVFTNRSGIVIRYEQRTGDIKKFKPSDILHLTNERLANQIHGTSVIDAVKWVIEAKNEAMDTMRKIMRRQLAMGVLELDTEDETKITGQTTRYQEAVNKGEVLVTVKGLAEIKSSPTNPPGS